MQGKRRRSILGSSEVLLFIENTITWLLVLVYGDIHRYTWTWGDIPIILTEIGSEKYQSKAIQAS
jgi:hypothetical protein